MSFLSFAFIAEAVRDLSFSFISLDVGRLLLLVEGCDVNGKKKKKKNQNESINK